MDMRKCGRDHAANFSYAGAAFCWPADASQGSMHEAHFMEEEASGLREGHLDYLSRLGRCWLQCINHMLLCNLYHMDLPDIPHPHGSGLKETWPNFG
jgi:hypothetical protein